VGENIIQSIHALLSKTMTINGKNYSSPKNINLKEGILRFNGTFASNPLGDVSKGLYVDSSGNLVYRYLTTSTILGAAGGGGSIPSWDSIIAGDQSMQIGALASFTIDRNSGDNDVLTITNTGAGAGDCIQITNAGSGSDIEGTSGTWSFSSAGDMIANTITLAGDEGSDSITLTIGDVSVVDGSLTIVDADDAATLSVTNDTATSASVFVFAGSGVFTGSTTTSFMTITPSGLTTGTAIYFPLAAMTTGTGMHIVCDTVTSGKVFHIQSGVTGTTMTANGRLFYIQHTGTGGNSVGALAEITSAVADETVIAKITASGALALGNALKVSVSSMTTGSGIVISDLDALTTGIGVHIASAATAITTTGRLLYVNHTGASSTTGTLVEFTTAATDETVLCSLTNSTAGQTTGTLLNVAASGFTTGYTGSVVAISSSSTTGAANVVSITGANTTAGNTLLVTSGVTTTNGRAIKVVANALTTGVGIAFEHTTSVIADGGSMVRLSDSGVATGGTTNGTILDIINTGSVAGTLVKINSNVASQTSTCLLDVVAAGYTTGYTGSVVKMTGCSTTGAGTVLSVTSANTTAGGAVLITSAATTTNGYALKVLAEGLTTGTGILFAHTTSVIADGGSMVRLSDSGVATGGASNGTILDIQSTGSTAGTLVKIKSNVAGQTTTCLLDVVAAGYTTGFTGSVMKVTGVSTTGAGNVLLVTGANTTAGETVKIDAAALTTGTGLLVTSAGVLITTGELVSLVANGATTCTGVLRASATSLTDGWVAEFTGGGANFTASGGMLNLQMGAATAGSAINITTSGVYAGTTGLIDINAASATTGVLVDIDGSGLTTGTAVLIKATEATIQTTGYYFRCYDGAANDFSISKYGATVIAGNATGTAALTITAGDLVLGSGTITYRQLTEAVTTTNILTAAESGKTCFLNSETEFATTLPAPVAGLHFKFIVTAAPSGASYTIGTNGGADVILGNIVSSADAGGSAAATAGTPADTITFVDGQAKAGDWVEVVSDGTYWYAFGIEGDEDAITLTAT
jgi:hypothetical protein